MDYYRLNVLVGGLFTEEYLLRNSIPSTRIYITSFDKIYSLYPISNLVHMQYQYTHTISNGGGEQLSFLKHVKDKNGDYLEVENVVQPNSGFFMHARSF